MAASPLGPAPITATGRGRLTVRTPFVSAVAATASRFYVMCITIDAASTLPGCVPAGQTQHTRESVRKKPLPDPLIRERLVSGWEAWRLG
ncbi:hypothetical protein GCM10009688_03170 [Arthrobacter gandavensis]|uniref:Uncharacterized protein n=1 Tax=Arthrobacter gandavensis TaxID=169960 RepID=A0ABN2NW62_9MICC